MSLVKQCQFRAIDEYGIHCLPLFIGHDLEKTAGISRSRLHPKIKDFVRAIKPTKGGIFVLVNAMGAGEYWGSNVNGDLFNEKSLLHAPPNWDKMSQKEQREVAKTWEYGYPTFMNAHPFRHHANKDPSRAFGRVEVATYNMAMHRVELVIYLDRALCKTHGGYDIIEKIEQGGYPDVSMGTRVPFDVCTICQHRSKTRSDYCDHALRMMNKILPDGRKVAVRNDFPRFFDISFVFIGADKTAKVMAKLAEKNGQVCMGDFCTVPRPSAEVGEVFSKEAVSERWVYERAHAGATKRRSEGKNIAEVYNPSFKKVNPTGGSFAHLHKADAVQAGIRDAFDSRNDSSRWPAGPPPFSDDRKHTGSWASKIKPPTPPPHAPPPRPTTSSVGSAGSSVARGSGGSAGKIGLGLGALALAGTGIYALKKHYDKKPLSKEASLFQDMKQELMGDEEKRKIKARKLATEREDKTSTTEMIPERTNADTNETVEKIGSPLRNAIAAARFLEKQASWKRRAVSSVVGSATGAGASVAGSHAVKADKESRNKDASKDAVAGALLGLMFPFGKKANDPIKKKVEHQGVPIHLEWLKGETRQYKDKKTGEVKYKKFMTADYGYIPETKDADGEEIDVYLGPAKKSRKAFIIKQLKKDGSFDENKVMIGYPSGAAAKESYMHHMRDCPECFGDMHEVDVGALRALFGENGQGESQEKHAGACECEGACPSCGGSSEKEAAAIFSIPPEKHASHRKLSEILKDIPAGPFTKKTLPKLESSERDLPKDMLDRMSKMPLSSACSTPAMMGIVLKPREFQRIVLIQIGDRDLADKLDREHMTFGHSSEVDESIPIGAGHVDDGLKDILRAFLGHRSAAGHSLRRRTTELEEGQPPKRPAKTSDAPVMKKLAAAYNGYRRALLKKAAEISQFLTTDPQLYSDLLGESMAKAFACGIDKVSSTSVLSPDSLAYLVGAYTDGDLHVSSKEVVASLALTGAVVEAA